MLETVAAHVLQVISNACARHKSVISGKPKDHSGKKIFRKVTLQILSYFIFYLSKFTNKKIPIWFNVNFGPIVFALLYCLLQ